MGKIYNEDIKEYFEYLKMSMTQLNPIFQKFEVKRDAYETFGIKLKGKKELIISQIIN